MAKVKQEANNSLGEMKEEKEVEKKEDQGMEAAENKRKVGRAPCCDREVVRRGTWAPEEDIILVEYITKHGHGNWRNLPKLAGLLRCGKSCRLRWLNYLRPDIVRGPFSEEDQIKMVQLQSTLGNKWSAIAAHFPGRTDNEVKNFWNSHLKKRIKQQQSPLLSRPLEVKKEPSSSDHHQMAQHGSMMQMPESVPQFPMDNPFLPTSPLPNKSDCDYFLRLWNSGVGETFRERGASLSPLSQVSSTTKDESNSGVTDHFDAGNQKQMAVEHPRASCKDSDNSKSFKLDGAAGVAKQPKLEFASGAEMDFLQECVDDVSMYLL